MEERYDVFVSYSHKDSAWVKAELLPRLKVWSVSWCIDFQDFQEGRPVAEELRRLVAVSRQTIIVLSSFWLSSAFADFELQLTLEFGGQTDIQRFLPIRIDASGVPQQLRRFQIIDCPHVGWEVAWRVLQRSLMARSQVKSEGVLAAEIMLSRLESEEGYEYTADLLVANIGKAPCTFDAVQLELYGGDRNSFRGRAQAFRVSRCAKGLMRSISYHGPKYFASLRRISGPEKEEGSQIEPITLRQLTATWLRNVSFGYSPVTVAGKTFIGLAMQLMFGESPVTQECVCVLPPVLRIPKFRSEVRHHIVLVRDTLMPDGSGLLERAIIDRILTTAYKFDAESLLLSVAPGIVRLHELTGGDIVHECKDWRFKFYCDKLKGTIEISATDPSWINEDALVRLPQRPQAWLNGALLSNCRVDCDLAYLIARSLGLSPIRGTISLEPQAVSGRWRPLWSVPFSINDRPCGVLADTGEVGTLAGEEFQKQKDAIWNCSED